VARRFRTVTILFPYGFGLARRSRGPMQVAPHLIFQDRRVDDRSAFQDRLFRYSRKARRPGASRISKN